jgi:hypothetical protein
MRDSTPLAAARRHAVSALAWTLVGLGLLMAAAAAEEHGLRLVQVDASPLAALGFELHFRTAAIHAYSLAATPLWMAGMLHLLGRR